MRESKRKNSEMANTKQKIDRWSSAGNTIIHVTQAKDNQTATAGLNPTRTMSTKSDSHHDE